MSPAVQDARPPRVVVGLSNPMLKRLLRTRVGRRMAKLALVEVTGRRSGRRLSVVVGWHEVDDTPLVFTPAPWQANFAGGAPATVHWQGRREERTGTLETDPAAVARALDVVIGGGTSPRALGLRVPVGHTVTAADVVGTGRAMVRFSAPI